MSKKNIQQASINHLTHDLNNILTRISNSIDLIKPKIQDHGELLPLVNNIENSINIAAEFIEEFNLSNQDKSVSKRIINIGPVVNEVVNSFKVQFKERINFRIEIEPNIRPILARYSEIYRVLMNLITNSSEAIDSTGNIYISAQNSPAPAAIKNFDLFSSTSKYVTISVKDDGKGIDDESLKKVFTEGYSSKNGPSSRGVGLNIVKKIVEEYNGNIDIQSESGKGTDIRIQLPSSKEINEKYSAEEKTILIAEDEPVLRELLTDLLTSHNFKVWSTENGKNVIQKLLENFSPDLIILDQKMPDMDGKSCIKKIREMKLKIPIVLATGSPDEGKNIDLENFDVERILTKPYSFDQMLSIIQELLG